MNVMKNTFCVVAACLVRVASFAVKTETELSVVRNAFCILFVAVCVFCCLAILTSVNDAKNAVESIVGR